MRHLIAALLLCALLGATLAHADHTKPEQPPVTRSQASGDVQVARSGPVQATLSYRLNERDYTYSGARLTITFDGAVELDAPVAAPCPGCLLMLAGGPQDSSLHLADLDGDQVGEVLVDLHTAGAHCCNVTRILRREPNGAWGSFQHDFADVGYRLEDLGGDGRTEMISADARFAYEFTSFADSAFPVSVRQLGVGELVDVTRQHRPAVEKDAGRWQRALRSLRSRDADVRGVMAAWAADECLLGRGRAALEVVRRRAGRGELRGGRYSIGPEGHAYARKLARFLSRAGYRC